MVRILAEIGDCFRIPLPDGRLAYGQYIFCHSEYASLVQIFDVIGQEENLARTLSSAGLLFPPVFVGFNDAIRQGHWRVIGNVPVEPFVFPTFRCTQAITHGLEPGVYHDWLLWDGEKYTRIGSLPPKYRSLEYLCGWASDHLEERITTGRNFPFGFMY
jgi:hypothetical protein